MTEAEIVIAKMVVDDSNIPKSCNEYQTIIEALEKQIPKKYVYKPHIISSHRCPNCDSFISISNVYCQVCGQHILWGEGDGE